MSSRAAAQLASVRLSATQDAVSSQARLVKMVKDEEEAKKRKRPASPAVPSSQGKKSKSKTAKPKHKAKAKTKAVTTGRIQTKDNPPPFIKLLRNEISHRARHKMNVEESACSCFPLDLDGHIYACGEDCWNRMVHNECHPKVCPCGTLCQNRRFQRRKYPKTAVFKTDDKGWGMRAQQDIMENEFIIEYVGEVIDTEECKVRLEHYSSSGRMNFYIITLSKGEFVDATVKGCKARFMNHSCNPNCMPQKWNVLGEMCVGIFATRDIKKGDELTFDYQFERVGSRKQRCNCGESNCRGYLGASAKDASKKTSKKTKAARATNTAAAAAAAAAAALPTRMRAQDDVDIRLLSRDMAATYDETDESMKGEIALARRQRLFLPRNLATMKKSFSAVYEEMSLDVVSASAEEAIRERLRGDDDSDNDNSDADDDDRDDSVCEKARPTKRKTAQSTSCDQKSAPKKKKKVNPSSSSLLPPASSSKPKANAKPKKKTKAQQKREEEERKALLAFKEARVDGAGAGDGCGARRRRSRQGGDFLDFGNIDINAMMRQQRKMMKETAMPEQQGTEIGSEAVNGVSSCE